MDFELVFNLDQDYSIPDIKERIEEQVKSLVEFSVVREYELSTFEVTVGHLLYMWDLESTYFISYFITVAIINFEIIIIEEPITVNFELDINPKLKDSSILKHIFD